MKRETKNSILKAVTAVALLIVLAFVIAYQNRDRSISGDINVLIGGAGDKESREIEGYGGGVTAPFGRKALLMTTNTFLIMDENGNGKNVEISFANPEISVGGDYVLVCDRGGRDFALFNGNKKVYENRFDISIISAKVNKNGYAAIAGEDAGGETVIMVYNDKGTPFYSWSLASGEFVDMDLCADSTRMVISSVSSDEDELRGELTVVRFDSGEKAASGVKSDEIYFNVVINRDHTVTALGSEQLDLYNSDATLRWSLDYGGKTLRGADIHNPDMLTLCYSAADSGLMGNSTEIEIVNRLGEITASGGFDGLCECLSVNGDLFAVSAGKKIYVYDSRCELKREMTADSSPKKISLFKSGKSVFALGSSGGSIVKSEER